MTASVTLESIGNCSVECPLQSMIEHLVANNIVYLIREILALIMQYISDVIIVTLSQ